MEAKCSGRTQSRSRSAEQKHDVAGKRTLSAWITMVRSSWGLRPAKSMTCEICSSDGAIEAMLATGSGDVGVGGIC